MTTKAKICGLSTVGAVTAAIEGKAVFVGFIFFPKSPRNIAPEAAAQLARPARAAGLKVVGVVVDPTDQEIDRIVSLLDPDLIQLHGKETPARSAEIARRT